ncbi:sensor domain-containing diguanylate cyclase [uncultured Ruminococcus sp.]|uniref:GGDEF domain-containing protein n=1 Tax=uncultured Ruminococcus sp. TaxID=165186 RepID=UPI0026235FDB|nr:sensor domain-containing diguanylate cyclase [uncultured Ruminococcus sp.]
MDYQSWIEGIDGLASLYSFDILPDGSFSEIRLMAVNKQNEGMLHFSPDTPEFYPGIPYRNYWMDLNFERYLYKSGSEKKSLYSYVNARGFWLKGFYIPVSAAEMGVAETDTKTVYCLYILEYADNIETDSMSQHSADVSAAVTNISIKLHEEQDFYKAMAETAAEIKQICGADRCSIFTVDKSSQKCRLINSEGVQEETLKEFAAEMECSPYEISEHWEKDLELSDCLILEDLKVIEERDPLWYRSLCRHNIRNIILFEIRSKQTLVGFIWAADYDTTKMIRIKNTLELTAFLLAAVIQNHQLISRLEVKSQIDGLTQLLSRNAMNERLDKLAAGETARPETLGIIFADLNGLKAVNDREGHDAGDKLLTKAAALLKIAFSDYDIYRAGGDEFVVLCPNAAEKRLVEMVSQLRRLADNTADVNFAVGIEYCTGSYDIYRAMQEADGKMYRDKAEFYRLHPEKDRRKRSRG